MKKTKTKFKIKKLFSTPKRVVLTLSVSLLTLAILGTVSVFSVYAIAESSSVGEEEAVNKAYAAAGIEAEKVDAVKTKFKFDDGKFVYDVEFYSEGKEYEYKIHSKNGSVVEFENSGSSYISENTITVDEAKAVALAHAGLVEGDVTFTKAKLDRDDGAFRYDIEFKTKNKKYEYEINAEDGQIVKTETENLSIFASAEGEKFISASEAKKAALDHAGITDAYFTKAKLEKDDGINKYEIDFIYENTEYEYDINAVNGEVLEFSSERIKNGSAENKKNNSTEPKTEPTEPIASGTPAADTSKSPETTVTDTSNTHIKPEDAKKIAFEDAGIVDTDVPYVSEKDFDDGRYVYDIEFSTEKGRFKYEIDAESGKIAEKEFKPVPSDESVNSTAFIGTEKAKETALAKAGLNAENVTFTKAKLEKDDGRVEYEIEFIYKGVEYEFSVDALTGAILDYEID